MTETEKLKYEKSEIRNYYETVCQTRYIEKEVIEDRPKCEDKRQKMCDDNGENCMEFTRRVNFENSFSKLVNFLAF